MSQLNFNEKLQEANLPIAAKRVYQAAFRRALRKDYSPEFANLCGWVGVGQAGYRQNKEAGNWKKVG